MSFFSSSGRKSDHFRALEKRTIESKIKIQCVSSRVLVNSIGFESSKNRSNYHNHVINKLFYGVVENPIILEHSGKDRTVVNNGSTRLISLSSRKFDEFRVLEHQSTGRKKKIEGIETIEDWILDISRGTDLDRTSELSSKLFSSPLRTPLRLFKVCLGMFTFEMFQAIQSCRQHTASDNQCPSL